MLEDVSLACSSNTRLTEPCDKSDRRAIFYREYVHSSARRQERMAGRDDATSHSSLSECGGRFETASPLHLLSAACSIRPRFISNSLGLTKQHQSNVWINELVVSPDYKVDNDCDSSVLLTVLSLCPCHQALFISRTRESVFPLLASTCEVAVGETVDGVKLPLFSLFWYFRPCFSK